MKRWQGRVAVVTGASAGIGAAIAYQLQDAGLTVVALARRVEKIAVAVEQARKEANERGRTQIGKASAPGKLHSIQCDVSKEEDILNAFKWIKENVGKVDVLVNNAGASSAGLLTGEANTSAWKDNLNTNVLGLSVCTREAIKLMREKGIDDGHVVHISSIDDQLPPGEAPGAEMYFASKTAVHVLTEGLRKELVAAKSKIRVTEVKPGTVNTEGSESSSANELGEVKLKYEEFLNGPTLVPEDIADAVLYSLSVPPHVQIHEIIVKPVGEPF